MWRTVVVFVVFLLMIRYHCEEMEELVPLKRGGNSTGTKSELCTSTKPCIRKCCRMANIVFMRNEGLNSSDCISRKQVNATRLPGMPKVDIYTDKFKLTNKNIKNAFLLINGHDKVLVKSEAFISNEPFLLIEDGTLRVQQPYRYPNWLEYDNDHFCIDHVLKLNGDFMIRAIVLVPQWEANDRSPVATTVSMLISSVFLVATLIVYSMQSKLRNLHGKVVMAYAASYLTFFLTQSIYQLVYIIIHNSVVILCHILALPAYYALLSTFFWSNVMSFDIWWKFRGTHQMKLNRRYEKRKFIIYSLYGFGSPLGMTFAFAILNYLPYKYIDSSIVTPGITTKGCFLGGNERLFYVYYPMTVLISANFLLFLATAYNIYTLKRDGKYLGTAGKKSDKQRRHDKEQLLMYLKIFTLMGVNWILEIISSMNPLLTFWYITDIYNSLSGFFIFFIFVCKKRIWHMVSKRKPETLSAQTSSRTNESTDRNTDMSDQEHAQS